DSSKRREILYVKRSTWLPRAAKEDVWMKHKSSSTPISGGFGADLRRFSRQSRLLRARGPEPAETSHQSTTIPLVTPCWLVGPSCGLRSPPEASTSSFVILLSKFRYQEALSRLFVGTDDIKRFLCSSYESLINIHSEGDCIKNQFNSKFFHMYLGSDQVKIEPVQLVPFTEELAACNKRIYPDDDISGWLSSIAARVPDRVLTGHVNMMGSHEIFGAFVSMYCVILRLKKNDLIRYNKVVKSWESI
ncbi:hypothetical protein ZWY2020_029554, partial [Hordeum vulgare]